MSRGHPVYFVENALFVLTTLETLRHFWYNNRLISENKPIKHDSVPKKITITTANSSMPGGSKILYILKVLTAS